VVLLILGIFINQVVKTAKASTAAEYSENRSFAAAANLFTQRGESLDSQFATLLTTPPETRVAARVAVSNIFALVDEQTALASHLAPPTVHGGVGDTYADLAAREVADWRHLASWWSATYHLSARDVSTSFPAAASLGDLATASAQWNRGRGDLAGQPGHVRLSAQVYGLVSLGVDGWTNAQRQWNASALRLTPRLQLAAILISPQPLPTSSTAWIVPASSSLDIGVSVRDVTAADQEVSWTLTVTPTNKVGVKVTFTSTGTLHADGALALRDVAVNVTPGEIATVRLDIRSAGAVGVTVSHPLQVIGTVAG
jgi:hypothetical protein